MDVSPSEDLLKLFDFVVGRLDDRLRGLSDAEWAWRPTRDPDLSVQWRLRHLTHVLAEPRNGPWLGLPVVTNPDESATDADHALTALRDAFGQWRDLVRQVPSDGWAQPLGAIAGAYRGDTRYSFALHVADELIHHGAEAALLRDLFADQHRS